MRLDRKGIPKEIKSLEQSEDCWCKTLTGTKSWEHTRSLPYLRWKYCWYTTRMIASKWISNWNTDVKSAKDLAARTIQQYYKSCKDTGNERILIIHWSCFETHFDWRTFFVTRCCWYFPIFRHLIILWLGNNIKIANFSTNVLSVFAISTCLQSFRILRSDFHK